MAYEKKCVICNKGFVSKQASTKTCSDECRRKRATMLNGRYSAYFSPYMNSDKTNKTISSSTVGAISEIEISSDLMKKGYAVFRAMSPSCFCDLIAIKKGKLFKIEVRTGYIGLKNQISFAWNEKDRGNLKEKNINLIAIYVKNKDKIYYFLDRNKKVVIK